MFNRLKSWFKKTKQITNSDLEDKNHIHILCSLLPFNPSLECGLIFYTSGEREGHVVERGSCACPTWKRSQIWCPVFFFPLGSTLHVSDINLQDCVNCSLWTGHWCEWLSVTVCGPRSVTSGSGPMTAGNGCSSQSDTNSETNGRQMLCLHF